LKFSLLHCDVQFLYYFTLTKQVPYFWHKAATLFKNLKDVAYILVWCKW